MPRRRRLLSISVRIALRERPAPLTSGRMRPWTFVASTIGRAGQLLQQFADDLFARAVRINVGGVEEIDAGVERLFDEGPSLFFGQRPRVRTAVGQAVAHAAEADAGNFEATVAEAGVVHRFIISLRDLSLIGGHGRWFERNITAT